MPYSLKRDNVLLNFTFDYFHSTHFFYFVPVKNNWGKGLPILGTSELIRQMEHVGLFLVTGRLRVTT